MARQKRYTLQELMDECAPALPRSAEEQAWLDMVPVGLEVEGLDPAESDSDPSETGLGAEIVGDPISR